MTLHVNKLESPPLKDALCQVWLKLAQWFWRRRLKCEKFTDRRTTGDQKREQKSVSSLSKWQDLVQNPSTLFANAKL